MCKKLGVGEQTFYRWRIKYGALKEDEAIRLKTLIAEQALDISMLKDLSTDAPIDCEVVSAA